MGRRPSLHLDVVAGRVRGVILFAAAMLLLPLALGGQARPAAADSTQHVWLHYDYMVAADGRSDAPDPPAIQLVVDAYAAHGVVLHVDGKHAAIPERKYLLGIASVST